MIWTFVMRLLEAIGQWRERRTAVHRLSRLNDHLLMDIGIHRHEIASVVHQSAKSNPVSNNGQGKTIALPNGSLMEA
jgi:uncharacterized protein YjiS (DUF1127 family)